MLWVILASVLLPLLPAQTAGVRECIPNSIINCGIYSKAEFKTKWNNGDGRRSAAHIQNDFEMLSINLSEFMSTQTVSGVVTKSGNVLVDGKVVATNAYSFGHNYKPGSVKVGDMWKRPTTVSFQSSQLEAYVYMKDGVFQWAVLKSCGNPVTAQPVKPPQPTFVCDDLTIVKVNGLPVNTDHARGQAPLRVAMKAKGSVTNTKIAGYIFNFGDGTPNKVAQYSTVAHTYTRVDSYTATVRIKTGAGTTAVVPRCTVTISVSEVPPPPPPEEGCIDVIKEAFDTNGRVITPTPQFTFRLDGTRETTNGGDGRAHFNDVTPGDHRVTEGLPNGWKLLSVTPAGGRVSVEAGNNCAVVVFKNQQEVPPPPPPPSEGCIDVIKEAFDTENSLMNPTPQFVFRLDGGRSLANGGDGRVRFNNVSVGEHRVSEGLPDGWELISVTPMGGRVTVEAGPDCAVVVFKNRQVLMPPPPADKFVCRDLKIVEINGQATRTELAQGQVPLTVKFEAKGVVRGGEIERYLFDFGDGRGARSPDALATHTYNRAANYRATVQIDTSLGTTPVRERCAVRIQTSAQPVTPPEETPPVTELPNTGAGAAMATLFGSGSLGYGIRAFRRSRRGLTRALLDL
ncbi:PKD domain-containing protein [Candidatus Microgenomates bacterium]|nr:PKD domain-containing protein [Candidatus Microgenomates bacterium]